MRDRLGVEREHGWLCSLCFPSSTWLYCVIGLCKYRDWIEKNTNLLAGKTACISAFRLCKPQTPRFFYSLGFYFDHYFFLWHVSLNMMLFILLLFWVFFHLSRMGGKSQVGILLCKTLFRWPPFYESSWFKLLSHCCHWTFLSDFRIPFAFFVKLFFPNDCIILLGVTIDIVKKEFRLTNQIIFKLNLFF